MRRTTARDGGYDRTGTGANGRACMKGGIPGQRFARKGMEAVFHLQSAKASRMPARKKIMDISALSESIAEALKEISTCGKSLTLANMSKALAHRKEITDLLNSANTQRETPPPSDSELEALKSQIEAGENRRKDALRQMAELEHQIAREREFFRRFTATTVNLARIPGNEEFFGVLDDLRTRVQENADLQSLESSLRAIKDRMLRSDVGGMKRSEKSAETSAIPGAAAVKSLFGRGDKGLSEEALQRLRNEIGVALEELQTILGEDFRASVHLAAQHIERSRDLEGLLAQKPYVLSLIGGYVQRTQKEKDQVTTFLREVSERLADMEKDMAATNAASREVHLDDSKFTENLESQLRTFHENVSKTNNFENLKSFVATQLTKISSVLHDRRDEYVHRIEKAERESESLKKNFKNLIGKVIDKNKMLMEEIQRDPLTEIYNRRTYEVTLTTELERFQRYRKPFTLIFFDVDHFKLVNDRFGHEAGDRVLKAISRRVRDVLRKPDVFARYGGEEFVVVLPETGLDNGLTVAMKIREVVEETVFEYEGERVPVTISLGVTEAQPADQDTSAISIRADKLLYRAKEEGRNRVISDFDMK